jgi:hypothetical protein
MNRLGIPQDRIAKRLGLIRTSLHHHLSKMPVLANSTNADLSRGFTVSQVAEKHNWTEPMVWSLAIKNKEDLACPHVRATLQRSSRTIHWIALKLHYVPGFRRNDRHLHPIVIPAKAGIQ